MNIRVLESHDAALYQSLRLHALKTSPEAFGSTYEREVSFSLETVAERIKPTNGKVTLGAFLAERQLIAIVTFVRETNVKTAHKGHIYGMYVSPDHRGLGIGRTLISELMKQASNQPGLEQINLTVVSDNVSAKKLYASLGFQVFGIERRALKSDGKYFDEEFMTYRI